jgi:hypothetical protein
MSTDGVPDWQANPPPVRRPASDGLIRFACPTCGKALKSPAATAGAKAACPRCGRKVRVPGGGRGGRCLGTARAPAAPPALPAAVEIRWLYSRGGAVGGPASLAELRRMAADGRLGRDDLVKEEGEDGWERADAALGLWPSSPRPEPAAPPPPAPPPRPQEAACPAPDGNPYLIPCGACGRSIAKEAAHCPGCGAPNRWTHPEILRFLANLRRFGDIPKLEAKGSGFVLYGRSTRPRTFADDLAGVVGSLGFFGPLSVRSLAGVVGMSLGARYISRELRKLAGPGGQAFAVSFKTDPPMWRSTDDWFWEPVMRFFGLNSDEPD